MSNKKSFLIVLAVILVLLIALGSYVMVYAGNGKNIIKSSINNTMDLIGDTLDDAKKEIKDIEKKTLSTKSEVKLNLDLNDNVLVNQEFKDLQEKLNKTNFKIDAKINQKQKVATVLFSLFVEDKELVNLDFVMDNKDGYLKLKDVVENYIRVDLKDIYDESDALSDLEFDKYTDIYEEIGYIYDLIDPVIRKEIMKGNIDTSKEEIQLKEKTVKVNKHTLQLDEKLVYNIAINVLETIKGDDKALDNIISILEKAQNKVTKEELLETINDEIDTLKEKVEDINEERMSKVYFSIYTKGIIPKTVQYSLCTEEKEDGIIKLVVNDKDNYSFKFVVEEKELVSAEGIIKKDEIDLKYKVSANEYDLNGEIKYKEEKSNKVHFEFTLDTGDDLIGSIGIIIDTIDDKLKDDIKFDVSGAKIIDDFSDDELMKIYENLESKLTQILEAYGLSEDVLSSILF